ncbi:hypothetical protein E2C01_023842 [Portunus trituberculatus]|uniref:Uncharacterized protein n=1 Tax=Portunus trituberculatus TaxID=210409 RepID=A0A5B7EB50_PORTR|nr:hypothetical protein [Portunus trituberculatus]
MLQSGVLYLEPKMGVWFNAKCVKAKNDKVNAWNRWRKHKTENRRDEYIKVRN